MTNKKTPKRRRHRRKPRPGIVYRMGPIDESLPDPPPFQGEMMTCLMCGRQEQSDPEVESQWRYLLADGVGYYACPDEFPADDVDVEAFKQAYQRVLMRIVEKKSRKEKS